MKFLIGLLLLSMSCGCVMATPHDHDKQGAERMIDLGIEGRIATSKHRVMQLAQENAKVHEQFDKFTKNLWQSYIKGQGFIESDIMLILDAIVFAAEKHQFQTRKDVEKTPYIIHPIAVANTLLTIGNVRDPDILIGALLHDTVEDTDTKFEEIEQTFGKRVAGFVREVTDDKSLPKQVRKQLQIEHASHKSAGAAQIKLADKLYNLNDLVKAAPADWEQERIDTYFRWAKAVVDNLPWVNASLKQAVDDVIAAHTK